MIIMNGISFLFNSLMRYLTKLYPKDYELLAQYGISDVYLLIQRRKEGGANLVHHLCSMLTNDGVKKKEMHERLMKETRC